jgi:DnaJ family protein C protein 3
VRPYALFLFVFLIASYSRKAVLTAHPDKGGTEAKMATVNEAYEVLTNPELRARFDNGDDPNDPMAGAGPGAGNPFGGGPNPFAHFFQSGGGGGGGGGGPFQFHQQQRGNGGFNFKFGGF